MHTVLKRQLFVAIPMGPIRSNGYYGYAWSKKFTSATIDLWVKADRADGGSWRSMEAVEAELEFLIRQAGRWPYFRLKYISIDQRRITA